MILQRSLPPSLRALTLPQRLSNKPDRLPLYSLRSFHATTRHRSYDTYIEQVSSAISGLHTVTGLPWVLTLPLTALIVRLAWSAPLSAYSKRAANQQVALRPLLEAWGHTMKRKVMSKHSALGPKYCHDLVVKAIFKKRSEIYGRWGAQRWKLFLPFLQLPVFLMVMDSIRRLCGGSSGLIPWTMDVVTWLWSGKQGEPLEQTAQILSPVEQSLSNEGALWFQNLLLPDPLLILPFMLSGTMLMTIYAGTKRVTATTTTSKLHRRFTNIMKIVALAIGPLTLQVPSAMLVYWISSFLLSMIQNAIFDKYRPQQLMPTVEPCKKGDVTKSS